MNGSPAHNWPNHDQAWHEWRSAMASTRMHHGWILAGKKGLGKLDFAFAAARELVAEEGIEAPQDHPDIVSVTYSARTEADERKQANGKDFEVSKLLREGDIGRMQRRLQSKPTMGSRRVVIIHPADDMNTHASNKLLKSLEEPPEGTFFMLVTHRPSRLLPTIRSRCRIVRFSGITNVDLQEMLEAAGQGGDLEAAIQAAEGSFGAALQFAQQDLQPVANQMTRLIAEGDRGLGGRTALSQLIGPRADRERVSAVFELAQSIVADRARRSESSRERAALIDAHGALLTLAAQAPSYNFDAGLLNLEIGTLLCRAHVASEPGHG